MARLLRGGAVADHPAVRQHFVQGEPLLWVSHLQLFYQNPGSLLHKFWNGHIHIEDLLVHFLILLTLECDTPHEHFVEQDSSSPDVHLSCGGLAVLSLEPSSIVSHTASSVLQPKSAILTLSNLCPEGNCLA